MHCSAKLEVMHYPNPPSSNKIKMVVLCGCLQRRRARNSTTPPNEKSILGFIIKCQLDSRGEVFLMHRDDNKTIRHFSGQFFFYLFLAVLTISHTESFVLLD